MSEARIRITAEDNASATLDKIGRGFSSLLQYGKIFKEWAEDGDRASDIFGALAYDIEGLRRATSGTVDALSLATAANRAHAAGLRLTQEQMEAVVAAATRYSIATGTDAASATQQLMSALVSGRERGLRPFGLSADTTAEALRQLTARAGENREEIARSTSTLDQFNTTVDDVTTSLKQMAADGVVALIEGLRSLSDEGTGSVARAGAALDDFEDHMFDVFNSLHRLLGLEERFTERQLFARRLGNVGYTGMDLPAPERGRRGALSQLSGGDPLVAGLLRMGTDRTEGTDSDTSARETPERRGGGGGGGRRRGPMDETDLMSDTPRRTRDDFEEDSGEDSLFGIPERQWQGRGAMSWAERQRTEAERSGARNSSAPGRGNPTASGTDRNGLRAVTREVASLEAAYEQLGSTATDVLDALGTAVAGHFEAWAMGRETMGEALAGMTADLFKWMGQQALKKAGMEAIEAIAAAARYDFGAAALHTAAAVGFGALAGGSFYVAGQVGGSSGRSTHGRDERSSTRDLGADRSLGGQGFGGPSVTINIAPGGIIGPDAAEVVGRLAVEGVNRGIRLGGMPRFDSSAIRTSGSRA